MSCKTQKYVGRDVVLEYAIGCGDTKPNEPDWKRIGAMRTKTFGLTWDSIDATADDSIGALRENLATFQNLEIGGDGVAKADDSGNLVELTKHVVKPTATNGQPVVWMRMTFPDLTFTAFMLVTDISRNAPTDDVVTYSLAASATASDFGLIVEDTPQPVPPVPEIETLTINEQTPTIDVDGGTTQLTVTVTPVGASTDVTWSSDAEGVATVDTDGLVTAIADGSANITATSVADPLISDTVEVVVTNQT